MKAIVLVNGPSGDAALLRERLATWQPVLVVAANGGSRYTRLLALRLDAVVGDLDSLDPALRDDLAAAGVHLEQAPAEKDETDLELALLYAAGRGATHIAVIGAAGGRLDMTLANVLLLLHPALTSVRVELWSGDQTAWLIRPPGDTVSGQPGDTLSLIPLGGDAHGIMTEGLHYPLRNETLKPGPARGISNVLTAPTARIDLREGILLAVHTPGRA